MNRLMLFLFYVLCESSSSNASTPENIAWEAVRAYRAGDFKKVIQLLQNTDHPRDLYNKGNALAHLGDYEHALEAYEQSLSREANDDARYNRDLMKQLLKKNKTSNPQTSPTHPNNPSPTKDPKKDPKKEHSKPSTSKDSAQNPSEANDASKTTHQKQQLPPSQNSRANHLKAQAHAPWQDRLPDDPGGLLKQKFLRDYLQRTQGDKP